MKQKVPLLRTDPALDFALSSGERVILFGAGIFLPPAVHSLAQRGIVPACIGDNSPGKQGRKICGIPVLPPAEALKAFPGAAVVITAAPQYIDEIRSQLAGMGWGGVYDCSCLLASFEYHGNTFASGMSELHLDLDRYFYEYFMKYYPHKLIIPSVDIVITERCSLRCRDCSNLMQYYRHPKDADFGALFASLDVLMASVDHVLEFRVLGGETFMNPQAHRYIEKLREYENFTRIAVYSNGTIMPTEEGMASLIREDTYLRVTDYGPLSRKVRAIVEAFQIRGGNYELERVNGWQDCASIAKRGRSPEELEALYSCCCANRLLTVLNGWLYICPFAANASNLGSLPPFPRDMVELNGRRSRREIRTQLLDMMRARRFFSACDYCAGRPVGAAPLPAAIQTPAPLPYPRFNA
jgi:hypothetical protein